jgi:hypothetical protein
VVLQIRSAFYFFYVEKFVISSSIFISCMCAVIIITCWSLKYHQLLYSIIYANMHFVREVEREDP